ncbi:ABC transporter ATP-binding protein [Kordiimonas pumila]|uniref:ABC transporter ATP-binding protein n=1 Tax=Kordiimonas pumila TaxID=2161677 RepID=A0ABV7D1S0_9PROT|nr:ABC transporter ATP-binding protein [Kordiimonas pumila]
MPVLELIDIKRSFQQGSKTLDILKGISLSVEPGELVALIGSSGSGKSTLLQVAGLLDSGFDGEIKISGKPMSGLKDDARSKVRREALGFVYQFHHLLPDFTALENVSIALKIAGVTDKEARTRAAETLDQLGLAERMDHVPSKLSGGEQQRVAIARAVVGKPSVLLADEPTGNLDEETAAKVFDLFLNTMKENKLSAIIATHDRALAAKLERQYVLRDGKLVTA